MVSPSIQAADTQTGWQQFKERYIKDDGRVIDSANNNISHSEGQGYGM
ncbi:glycosyl hydrolase family 8, partial [Morganella morganii]